MPRDILTQLRVCGCECKQWQVKTPLSYRHVQNKHSMQFRCPCLGCES